MARGRIPSIESLESTITKLEKRVRRGKEAEELLVKVKAKKAELSSPEYRKKRAESMRAQLEKLQASLARLEAGDNDDGEIDLDDDEE